MQKKRVRPTLDTRREMEAYRMESNFYFHPPTRLDRQVSFCFAQQAANLPLPLSENETLLSTKKQTDEWRRDSTRLLNEVNKGRV